MLYTNSINNNLLLCEFNCRIKIKKIFYSKSKKKEREKYLINIYWYNYSSYSEHLSILIKKKKKLGIHDIVIVS